MSIDIKIKTSLYVGAIAHFKMFARGAGGSLETHQQGEAAEQGWLPLEGMARYIGHFTFIGKEGE